MPARLAIFVAQLGRKFRLISLTMQRYESFIAVYEFSGENFRFFSWALRSPQVSPRGDLEGVVFLGLAAARCSVAVLERLSNTLHLLLYIYIYKYI